MRHIYVSPRAKAPFVKLKALLLTAVLLIVPLFKTTNMIVADVILTFS